jgi:PAS domain S-box-containing protein
LKDISDRREAERRYRELFDNIQEGLFFSTPGGSFIEVNDAMVRMLGYSSREELLQVDTSTQLYLSPGQREHAQAMLRKPATCAISKPLCAVRTARRFTF